jgi:hypothetical protein
MKLSQGVFLLFAMLGVVSARVDEHQSVNESDQGETRNLVEEDFIEIEFTMPTDTIVNPGRAGSIMALGGPMDNCCVMVGYKNEQGKLKAMATDISELLTEFKMVNALTMIIPRAQMDILANDPDIE